MARVLVTGAAGFVGTNLVRTLLAAGDEVHVLLRAGGRRDRLTDIVDRLVIHEADIADRVAVGKAVAVADPARVFHLAQYGGNRGEADPAEVRRVVIDGTSALYEACAKLGALEAIVHAGSSSEYGTKTEPMQETTLPEPNSFYGLAKLWATLYGEHLRREQHLPITTLRLFSVYGPYEAKARLVPAVILALMDGKTPTLANPKTGRDFVHVDDVVRAFMMAVGKPKGIYNIGTGVQTTLKDAVDAIQQALGSTTELTWGVDQGRAFDTVRWVGDPSRAKNVLGWEPTLALSEGIGQTVDWFRTHRALYA